jgi:cytoskeletal protein CcmA (bactofilin family)
VVGTLRFEGASEIGGSVEGEIFAEGRLVIGETAKVKARVQGVEVVVRGTVEGDIIATKKLALLRPARVAGNIASASLSIEEGVVFEGGCEMLKSASSVKNKADASKDSSSKPSDIVA